MAHVHRPKCTSRARPRTSQVPGRARDVRGRAFWWRTCAIYSMVVQFGSPIFIWFSKYTLKHDVYMFATSSLKYFKVQSLVKKVIFPRKSDFQVNVEATMNCFSAQKTPSLSRIRIIYRLIRPNSCRNAQYAFSWRTSQPLGTCVFDFSPIFRNQFCTFFLKPISTNPSTSSNHSGHPLPWKKRWAIGKQSKLVSEGPEHA